MSNESDSSLMSNSSFNANNIKKILIFCLGFALCISTVLTNTLLVLLGIWLIVNQRSTDFIEILKKYRIAQFALAMTLLISVGVLYSPTTIKESMQMWVKYREFLYVPFFLLLFNQAETRTAGSLGLIAGISLTLLLSYMLSITGWQWLGKGTTDNPFIFKTHITQGILCSFVAYYWLSLAVLDKRLNLKSRWLFGIATVLAIVNCVAMIDGRTAYLVLLALFLLAIYQKWRWFGLFLGSNLLILALILSYQHSQPIQDKIHHFYQKNAEYADGSFLDSTTLRYDFLQKSAELTLQAGVFGWGTGSFSQIYKNHFFAGKEDIHATHNAHNEYFMIGIQWGWLGLGVFFAFIISLWRQTWRLAPIHQQQAQAFVVIMATACLVNSLWLDNTEGHLFVFLIGMFFGGSTQSLEEKESK